MWKSCLTEFHGSVLLSMIGILAGGNLLALVAGI